MNPSPSYQYVSSKIRIQMQKCAFLAKMLFLLLLLCFGCCFCCFSKSPEPGDVTSYFYFLIRRLLQLKSYSTLKSCSDRRGDSSILHHFKTCSCTIKNSRFLRKTSDILMSTQSMDRLIFRIIFDSVSEDILIAQFLPHDNPEYKQKQCGCIRKHIH